MFELLEGLNVYSLVAVLYEAKVNAV